MSKIKIAITGTIGSGKSTVCDIIRNNGYDVFDCDKYNSELLNKKDNIEFIKKEFNAVKDGTVDKKMLAKIVFQDKNKKKILEEHLHPQIIEEINRLSELKDVFFAEVPLLFESNFDKYFDINVLVLSNNCDIKTRLLERGLDECEINERIANQMSQEDKKKKADKIIYNVSDIKALENKTIELLKELGC